MENELHELTDAADLEKALADSSKRLLLIFKHSATCSISSRAFNELKRHLAESASSDVDYGLIVVQNARSVSNAAAEKLGIEHASPQAILVRNGRALWNASHYDITNASLSEAIKTNS